MLERLGGEEARLVAERYFGDPSLETFEAYAATCLPLYNPTPADADVRARMTLRPEVNFHFFREELRSFDWFGDLERVRCPTLILAGELDPITTVPDHEEMAAAIPGSRLEVFDNAGHGVFRDRPDAALNVIRDFIFPRSGSENAATASA